MQIKIVVDAIIKCMTWTLAINSLICTRIVTNQTGNQKLQLASFKQNLCFSGTNTKLSTDIGKR